MMARIAKKTSNKSQILLKLISQNKRREKTEILSVFGAAVEENRQKNNKCNTCVFHRSYIRGLLDMTGWMEKLAYRIPLHYRCNTKVIRQ